MKQIATIRTAITITFRIVELLGVGVSTVCFITKVSVAGRTERPVRPNDSPGRTRASYLFPLLEHVGNDEVIADSASSCVRLLRSRPV